MRKQLLLVGLVALGAVALSGCKIVVDGTYGYCRDTSECDSSDVCARVTLTDTAGTLITDGNTCTYGCNSDAACERSFGRDGACYSLGFGATPQICFQTCAVSGDCHLYHECVEVTESTTGLMNRICMPDRL